VREQGPVPVALQQAARLAGQVESQIFAVADADDPDGGIERQQERRKGHRHDERLQLARRQVDDQAPLAPLDALLQKVDDGLDVPVVQELLVRVQRVEGMLSEQHQILGNGGQEGFLLGQGHGYSSPRSGESERAGRRCRC
jgi:hypothetical protein